MKAICKICYHYELCKADERCLPEYLNCNFFKNKLDVVEVVRCKDCKRYIKGHAGEQSNYCDCHTTTFEKFFCIPNDYCSCGERKCDK